jgi:hypothetical protein
VTTKTLRFVIDSFYSYFTTTRQASTVTMLKELALGRLSVTMQIVTLPIQFYLSFIIFYIFFQNTFIYKNKTP